MGHKALIQLPQCVSKFEREAEDQNKFGLFEPHVKAFIKDEEVIFSCGAAWPGEKTSANLCLG